MTCNNCNHKLPDDSEFCQYCGNKIEKPVIPVDPHVVPVGSAVNFEVNTDGMSPDEALNAILKIQAKNTVKAMEANSKTQPDNEGDADFGLVPEKPIYTLALQMVDGEKEYLNKLYTHNGEQIRYNRRGSTSVEGINGMIDIYDTFLPSGQLYKTIYINMYGAKKSTTAPNGFVFAKPMPLTTPKNNISAAKSNTAEKTSPNDNLVAFTNISSIVLTIISMLSIIVAMNVQDVKRNYWENWNPTVVYIVLLLILGAFLWFAINSLVKKRFKLLSALSTVPIIAAIITSSEHSIMSYDKYYLNSELVAVFNTTWIICVVCILFITLTPVAVVLVKKLNNIWHKSISYREKCYKRVALIHSYLEKGIITEAEYEKTKRDILKYLE